MRRLALDCSGDLRSVAFAEDATVVAEAREEGARGHAERLIPLVEAARAEAGWSWSSVDHLAVAVGPGSFTGVRVAVAAARALALALDRPVQPVTTLDALMHAASFGDGLTVPAIDARRGGLYLAWPDAGGGLGPPLVLPTEVAAGSAPLSFTTVGSGAEALVAAAGRGEAVRRAVEARFVAVAAAVVGTPPVPGPAVRPLYVRPADATPRAA